MNRTAIKNFATWARRKLREQVRARAAQFGISPSEILAVQAVGGGLIVAGQTLNADEAERIPSGGNERMRVIGDRASHS